MRRKMVPVGDNEVRDVPFWYDGSLNNQARHKVALGMDDPHGTACGMDGHQMMPENVIHKSIECAEALSI
jgi:hypothetical protein